MDFWMLVNFLAIEDLSAASFLAPCVNMIKLGILEEGGFHIFVDQIRFMDKASVNSLTA